MIGRMNDPVGQVSERLRSRGIILPSDNEWLNACVECFTSNNPNSTADQLLDFVFEQWTLADLSDVGAPSLPPGCVNCNKMMLTGKYAVQINYFLNVGTPLHKQLQKIRRPDAQRNLEVDNERQERDKDRHKEVTGRTLKMEITDGITTVIGFEDQPIPNIKNPIPGEKALLSGPIEVRKGILMLKAANVTILGGEVDTLLVKNAPENLLARALKQPENSDPYGVNPALRDGVVSQVPTPAPVTQQTNIQPVRCPEVVPTQAAGPQRTNIHPVRCPEVVPTPAPAINILDALDDGEDEALASVVEALENDSFHLEDSPRPPPPRTAPTKPKPPKQQPITAFLTQPKKPNSQVFELSSDDGFDEDFELIAAQTASLAEQQASLNQLSHNPEKLKKQLEATYAAASTSANGAAGTNASATSKPPERPTNKRKVENDIFGRPKIPNESPPSETPPPKTPRLAEELFDWLPPPPKANLEHVRPSHEKGKILVDYTDSSTINLDSISTPTCTTAPKLRPTLNEPFPPKEFPATRTTSGKVVKVEQKLQLRDAKWILSATVEAKGVQLEMDFASEALDKIFTVTAEEITRQKEQLKKNPELKEKFNGHLRESQRRIQTLNCEMTIHFKNFISKPVVLDVST